VQYSSNSGSTWTTFADGTSTSAAATVTGLTNGTSYTFRVAAVNGIGQGAWSSASAAVTPAAGNIIQTTSGLYAWYDAADANSLYNAQSGGSVVTSDNGLIYRVADKSGNSRHLYTFDNGSSVPRLALAAKNGRNAILFDNTSRGDTFKTAANRESGSFNTGNPLTIFAVWKPLDAESNIVADLPYSWGDREYSTAVILGLRAGAVRVFAPQQGAWGGANYSRSGNWLCVRARLSGATTSLTVNGATDGPAFGYSEGTQELTHPCADFRMTGSFQFGELVFFSGALSDSTASAIETYLMTKWGIS
jgi:hypothetical protein